MEAVSRQCLQSCVEFATATSYSALLGAAVAAAAAAAAPYLVGCHAVVVEVDVAACTVHDDGAVLSARHADVVHKPVGDVETAAQDSTTQ
jgi:hypothetical protein